jgi:hypothetical protein
VNTTEILKTPIGKALTPLISKWVEYDSSVKDFNRIVNEIRALKESPCTKP